VSRQMNFERKIQGCIIMYATSSLRAREGTGTESCSIGQARIESLTDISFFIGYGD